MFKTLESHVTSVACPQHGTVAVPQVIPKIVIVIVVAFTVLRVAGVSQDAALTGLTAAVSLGVGAALRLASPVRAEVSHA
jgi:hypothetical protein